MSDYRISGLTRLEQKQFTEVFNTFYEHGRGRKDSLLRRALVKYKTLSRKYTQHIENFSISNQERWSIFLGEVGLCEACGAYTKWKRPNYRRFCSNKCAGLSTVAGRKQTCLERYGVEYTSQLAEVRSKMSASMRKAHAAKGRKAPRKGKFKYVPQKVRPNTGTAFYVYVLLDPRKEGAFSYGRWKFDHEPFYVGKGKGDRAFDHLRQFDLAKGPNPHKKNKIAAIVKAGLEPIVCLKKTDLNETQALEIEARLIHAIGFGKFGPLTNTGCSIGGIAGYEHSDATKEKLSALSRKSWADLSNEQREVRSSSLKPFDHIDYKLFLKTTFLGRIRVVFPKESRPRKSYKYEHRCVCGHVWVCSPTYMEFHQIGCSKCGNAP